MNLARQSIATILSCILFAVCLPLSLYGQSCAVKRKMDDGYYLIEIDGKSYQAFAVDNPNGEHVILTSDAARKVLFRNDSLKAEIAALTQRAEAKDSLIAQMDRTIAAYDSNTNAQNSLLTQTNTLYKGYRDLYLDLKRNFEQPWLQVSGGLGVVRESEGDQSFLPVILLGLSVHKFSVWGFLNSEQSGFIFGVNYPLSL